MARYYFQISSGKILLPKKSSSNMFRIAKNKDDEWVIFHTNLKTSYLSFEIEKNFEIFKNNLPLEKRKNAKFLWKYSDNLKELLGNLIKKHFLSYSEWINYLLDEPK